MIQNTQFRVKKQADFEKTHISVILYYKIDHFCPLKSNFHTFPVGIAISHEKWENGKFVDEKFLTGKSDEKNGKLSSLKLGIFG